MPFLSSRLQPPAIARVARARRNAPARLPRPQRKSTCACGGGCPRCRAGEPETKFARSASATATAESESRSGAAPVVREGLRSAGTPLDAAAATSTPIRVDARVPRDDPAGENAGGGGGSAERADTKPETTTDPAAPKADAHASCDPQPLPRDQYLKHDGTSTHDFGLTRLAGTVSVPTARTRKVAGGVVLENTAARMPAIDSVFTQAGRFVEGTSKMPRGTSPDCTDPEYPTLWIIDKDGADLLRTAEIEHCDDFKYAFDISIGRYADIVNRLANSGRKFASTSAAIAHVTKVAGAAPDTWADVFDCLVKKTKDRDDLMQWHVPHPQTRPPTLKTNCAHAFSVITKGSLQNLGHQPREIINGCNEGGAATPAPAAKKTRGARAEVAKPVPQSASRVSAHVPLPESPSARRFAPDTGPRPEPNPGTITRTGAPSPQPAQAIPAQAVPADAGSPTMPWSSDLLTIVVGADRADCVGMASPGGDVIRYGNCASPVKPPFCQSARVPFKIEFFVDRGNAPISQPFTPPRLRVKLEFVTTGGKQQLNIDEGDAAPGYDGPNKPLVARFGSAFPVGSADSGTLTMRVEMLGIKGMDVIYTDTLEYVIVPCA